MPDGPFDKLGKFKEWDGSYAIWNSQGQLLSKNGGVTRQGCRELYHSEPPLSADILIVNGIEHRIIDGSHAADN